MSLVPLASRRAGNVNVLTLAPSFVMQERALGRLLLIGLAVIPLLPVCLQAQNCLGFASFTHKPYQFTQRMAFSRADLLGVWATFRGGRRAYGEVEVGTLLDPGNDTYPNYRELTLGGGYELPRGRTLFICPLARIGAFATSGKYDPSGHGFAIAAGLSAGLKLGNDPDAHQVVSMGLRLDHRRSKTVLGADPCACDDSDVGQPPSPPGVAKSANYAVLSAGASFASGAVTARPSATLPVRVGPPSFAYCSARPASDCYLYGPMLDSPSVSLEVAVSFGHAL